MGYGPDVIDSNYSHTGRKINNLGLTRGMIDIYV